MGEMIDGLWRNDQQLPTADAKPGEWKRTPSVVKSWVKSDPSDFPPTPGRYHLYAAWNCPWAHRVLLARALLRLEDVLPTSYVSPRRTSEGWVFDTVSGFEDKFFSHQALHQVYAEGDQHYTGRVTVPLLFDTTTNTLVSNESADILRMLGSDFSQFGNQEINLVPDHLRSEIHDWNDRIHTRLNNGVYRAGFAGTQEAYDVAVDEVFNMMAALETRLTSRKFIHGDLITETDLRIFPTLARFDVGYALSFRCTRRRLIDHPNLWRYAREIYALPGLAATVDFDVYRRGYASPSPNRNPLGIVPTAPDINWAL